MKEILPGIFHWTQTHPKIKIPVSSYYLTPEGVLIDPLIPDEGLEWFAGDPPKHVYMSIRHHYRHCGEFSERFGCDVWCVEQGLHEFTKGEVVRAFKFGDMLPGNIKAIEIGSLCPDEGAFYIDREGGCVVLADGCVRRGDGPLQCVPDQLLGDDPAAVKSGLKTAYRRVLEDYVFTNLLLAHGKPLVGDGRAALEAFVAG
ncbi:MAG: hypothetical protein OER85_00215 [Gammaproteobacteria bacterium]|nr:hypothetical protein [Gammaproteobacteria bacterium]